MQSNKTWWGGTWELPEGRPVDGSTWYCEPIDPKIECIKASPFPNGAAAPSRNRRALEPLYPERGEEERGEEQEEEDSSK